VNGLQVLSPVVDEQDGQQIPVGVRIWVASTITALWVVVNLGALASYWWGDSRFEPSTWIGATMLGTAAAIFGTNFRIR